MAVFTALGSAIATATGLAWLGTAVAAGARIVTGIAFSLIGKAMQGEPEKARFGVQGKLQAGEDMPRTINLGWNCTAGSLAYHNTFGDGGVMSARVIALGDLPIRELQSVIVDGVDCTLLTGEAHPDYGWPVEEYRKGAFLGADVDHLWIKFYDGTQTAADPFLVSEFGNDPDRPYGATRVGRGVPYVVVFARAPSEAPDDEEKPLFQGIPNLKFATHGVRWYNLAQDSTAGGSGTHRFNDPSTWGGPGDFNPIVHLYNIKRGVRFNGQWLYGLQNTSPARLPAANWIAGINAAQASITGPGGAEPTFRAGGEVQVGAQVAVTEEALLTAANARLVEVGGVFKVFVGAPGAPVMAFTDGDILSTEEQSFTPFFSLADSVNGVDASHPNPAEGWNAKKAPPLLRPDLEALDGNRRLLASVSLDLVPYAGQVQRLMQWALAEALRARRHTFVLGPEFRVLEPGDVVSWTSARNGYVEKLFRVDGVIYKSNLDVIVDLTEVDPSDYDWNQATDWRPVVDGPLTLVGPKPMPMQGWQVFPATIPDGLGRPRRPSIEVRFASGMQGARAVRVLVRIAATDEVVFDGEVPYAAPWAVVLQGQFLPDTAYEVRGIPVGLPRGAWSAWLPVTTPDIKLGPLDVYELDLENLNQSLNEAFADLFGNAREILAQAQALATSTADEVLANYADHQQIRRSLSSVHGQVTADYLEAITVATGPGSAIASRIEALEVKVDQDLASAVQLLQADIATIDGKATANANAITALTSTVNDVASSVTVRGVSTAGPGGGWAAWGVEVKVGSGPNDWSSGAFLIETNGAQSRAVFDVDQFIVRNAGNAYSPFIVSGGAVRANKALIYDLTSENMRTNSLDASVINVDNLFAQNANVTGTLRVGTGTTGPGIVIDGPNNRIVVSD